MNRHGKKFIRPLSLRYVKGRLSELASPRTRLASDPLGEWAQSNIRLAARRFSFSGHEYLKDIYNEVASRVVLMKAAQIGGTTWAVLASMYACLKGHDVIYYTPSRTDAIEFSKSRVSPLIAENRSLANLVTDTNTAGLKRIGNNFIYFRGMKSTVGLKSAPADMLVIDEMDEASGEARMMAAERLSHSLYGRILELSNPTLPSLGISGAYDASDQRHWTIKCGCNRWVALDKEFPTAMGQPVPIIRQYADDTYYYACPACGCRLDISKGQWVADFPSRDIRGYLISQLFSSRVDPAIILKEYQTTPYPAQFYHLKIGIPWADESIRVEVSTVLGLCTDEPMGDVGTGRCFMGVDVGKRLHVVVQRLMEDYKTFRLVHLAELSSFHELDELMRRFKPARCVIDAQPDLHSAHEFAERHRGRVYLCGFNENQLGAARWDHQDKTVSVNRTEALDASRAALRERRLVLPRRDPKLEEFARHNAAVYKELERNDVTGKEAYRYRSHGEDHYSFAFTYAWLAASCRLPGQGVFDYYRQEAERIRKGR